MFLITALLFSFVAVMLALLMLAARHPEIAGRSAAIGAKAAMVGNADWPAFWNLENQVILSLGVMGFGFVASWVFGREYSDRVVKDLLALPVARSTIVLSKFIVIALWCTILVLLLWGAGLITGLVVRIPNWSAASALENSGNYLMSASLTMLLCTPVAFIASMGRGYLLPIGFALLTLIITNLVAIGLPGFAPYFPWAFPALFSGVAGGVIPQPDMWSYIIYLFVVALGYAGTVLWWQFADQV
jgi:ABC-2 type transport system permease protein